MSFILCCGPFVVAQEDLDSMDEAEIKEVIDSVASILNRNYIFPEVAEKMSSALMQHLADGRYQTVTDPREFANMLTQDVQAISHDLHLRISFAPQRISDMRQAVTPEDSLAFVQRMVDQAKRNNFGFQKIEFLDGNIGYLNLTGFAGTEFASETATAAMNYLSNSDALIIDLRQNGGGSPQMIQLITSYLFPPEPVHLNNFYYRPSDEHSQTWTLPYVPGNRMPNTNVYVLTSNRTFSAAEEFSYNLRNLERATLIGETTGGGAHPGGSRIATDRFMIWVPTGRAINPITKTNWEGTGVEPHIKVSADEALAIAHQKALEDLMATANDEQAAQYQWALESVQAKANPASWDPTQKNAIAGLYGPRQITLVHGELYYARDGRSPQKLIPINQDTLMVEDVPFFRIRVMKEDGKVIGLKGLYQDGREDVSMRSDKT